MPDRQRIIFLAGAPEAKALTWADDQLTRKTNVQFSRFLQQQHLDLTSETPTQTPLPIWRSVPLFDERLRGKLARINKHSFGGTIPFDGVDRENFLEHSITVFEGLESSQLVRSNNISDHAADEQANNTTFLSTASFNTTKATEESSPSDFTTSFSPLATDKSFFTSLPSPLPPITDLKQILSADHISRIRPQTVTVSLLVGVIAISPVRTVRLRQRNTEMDLLELTVGDETKAGFTITFWLAPTESRKKPVDDLRVSLSALRPGNVVLLQNVALSCFRGCVFGQSLNRSVAINSTHVIVVNGRIAQELTESGNHIAAKYGRVKTWTANFVAVPRAAIADAESIAKTDRGYDLPPDTQE